MKCNLPKNNKKDTSRNSGSKADPVARNQDKEKLRRDVVLLKEYGFKKSSLRPVPGNVRKIDRFGMRQLDRLKLLLLRNERLIGAYPQKVRGGIGANNSRSFAEALALLSLKLGDFMT